MTLRNLRLSGGHAYQGGAIFNYGTLRVDGSRIDHNTADNSGGGIYSAMGGVLTLVDTVVADNRATYAGGGVYAGGGGYRDGSADAGVIAFDRVHDLPKHGVRWRWRWGPCRGWLDNGLGHFGQCSDGEHWRWWDRRLLL